MTPLSYQERSLADDYSAVRTRSGIGAIAPRRQIAVGGKDRATYLQGLLTNDIQALVPGTGCYSAWLTPQGRMITDLHVLESGEMIVLDVPAEVAAFALEQLDKFLFGEDVQLASLDGQLMPVWIHGPAAGEALERSVAGLESPPSTWPDYRVARGAFGVVPIVAVRIDQLGVPGYCVYLPVASEPDLRAAFTGMGAFEVSPAAIEALRIEAGYPLFGLDMTGDTIPLEAGIEERAISFSKGCYVGQEVIIRVVHRGHGRVAKKLVGFRLDSPAAAGSKVLVGDREIGFVTSSAESPTIGAIALGYVHRDFVEPGTAVHVRSGELVVPATVASRPFTR